MKSTKLMNYLMDAALVLMGIGATIGGTGLVMNDINRSRNEKQAALEVNAEKKED